MNVAGDLKNAHFLHAKGIPFIIIGLLAGGLLILELPSFKTAALLAVTVWAFCRFNYYLFLCSRSLSRAEKTVFECFDALRYLPTRKE